MVTPVSAERLDVVESAGFRSLMARFPSGVAIVTAIGSDGRPWGMTCSSVCSVTTAPPTLLVCLRDGSPTLAAVRQRATFAVNLLDHRAQGVAELFASGAPDRFDRILWDILDAAGGPHLADYATAIADCRVSRTETVGDHTVVFGEVFRVQAQNETTPLMYGLRRYGSWPFPNGG